MTKITAYDGFDEGVRAAVAMYCPQAVQEYRDNKRLYQRAQRKEYKGRKKTAAERHAQQHRLHNPLPVALCTNDYALIVGSFIVDQNLQEDNFSGIISLLQRKEDKYIPSVNLTLLVDTLRADGIKPYGRVEYLGSKNQTKAFSMDTFLSDAVSRGIVIDDNKKSIFQSSENRRHDQQTAFAFFGAIRENNHRHRKAADPSFILTRAPSNG